MIKPSDPRQLAIDLMARSICSVQVAAVAADYYGIFGWGWNSVGKGFGEHAECAVMRRSSKRRLRNSVLYVASQRKRNGKMVYSLPCHDCRCVIAKNHIGDVWFRDDNGIWRLM